MRDLGAEALSSEIEFSPIPEGEGPWLAGRGASISVAGEIVGTIGEIDPVVGDSFELRVPIQAGEFDIEALGRLIPDPVL